MIYSPSQLGSADVSTTEPDPYYLRIYRALKAQIDSGRLPPGSKLPTKVQLQIQFGVSVQPVERALDMLRERGLVRGERGRGIYVVGGVADDDDDG